MVHDPIRDNRLSLRLNGYDYRQPGAYFVTICTRRRRCFFGEVTEGRMCLSSAGQIARSCWLQIPDHYAHVRLDASVVMPNHVHGILVFTGAPSSDGPRRDAIHRVQTGKTREKDDPETRQFGKPQAGSLSTVIRTYKAAVTRLVRRNADPGFGWQSRFHDHIIRHRRALRRIRRYIHENPERWSSDRYFQ